MEEKNIKKSTDHFFFTQIRKKEGGNRGIRTLGPCLAKAVLYQLSYIPIFAIFCPFFAFFEKQKKDKKKLDHTGLEPVTSRLSSVRSNQLS